jgi:ParB family transcriptional regulator, chromosome partitioning protein
MKLEITYKPASDLIPFVNNSRTHSDEQVQQIAASIKEFGFTNPILLDEDGGIIAGHGRLQAARLLGLDDVPTITLAGLDELQKRAYVIADNKLALNAGWDAELLQLEIQNLQDKDFDISLLGFDEKELMQILGEDDDEVVAEIKFSEELMENHNYVVLYFDNDMDWLSAQTHFNLESVHSKRANGKPWSKGVGRVVNGAKYLTALNESL